ncbi:MAG: hypothetical protein Q9168_007712, partial [Polycauliona sp. 1 TL-2023]
MEQFDRAQKGDTVVVGDITYWYPLNNPHKRIPAVFHGDIRQQLLNDAGDSSRYSQSFKISFMALIILTLVAAYGRQKGESATDETAHHPAQADWGESADNLPSIIDRDRPANRLLLEPKTWYYKGQVVIDWEKKPMVEFLDDLPLVLSSKFEPPFIEAIRRQNMAVMYSDFVARMPNPGPNVGTLQSRTEHFRRTNGVKAWKVMKARAKAKGKGKAKAKAKAKGKTKAKPAVIETSVQTTKKRNAPPLQDTGYSSKKEKMQQAPSIPSSATVHNV